MATKGGGNEGMIRVKSNDRQMTQHKENVQELLDAIAGVAALTVWVMRSLHPHLLYLM